MSEQEAALVFAGETSAHRWPAQDHEGWMRLKGVAARRGEVRQPRTLEAARAVMADVASGELLERLAAECLRWSSL